MRRTKEQIRDYKLSVLMPRLCFIDIEASDGGPDGWPIEIGFAAITLDTESGPDEDVLVVESTGHLIRPHESWDDEKWSRHAQAVHGIERSELENGVPAEEVSEYVLKLAGIDGIVFVSDSPRNDQPWLDHLLELKGQKGSIEIQSIWSALQPCLDPDTIKSMKGWLKENKSAHRADKDASRLAQALIKCRFDCDVEPEVRPDPSVGAAEIA